MMNHEDSQKMELKEKDLVRIGEYVQQHLRQWMEEANTRRLQVWDLEQRERIIRVEEELKSQRDLMKQGFDMTERRFELMEKRFEQIDKRFEQVDERFKELREDMNRRFEQVDRHMDLFEKRFSRLTVLITAGFTMITVLITVYKFLS